MCSDLLVGIISRVASRLLVLLIITSIRLLLDIISIGRPSEFVGMEIYKRIRVALIGLPGIYSKACPTLTY